MSAKPVRVKDEAMVQCGGTGDVKSVQFAAQLELGSKPLFFLSFSFPLSLLGRQGFI